MTDVELVERAAAGDMEAVERLHATYSGFMLKQAYRFGAGQDAEDVVHEQFVKLAEGDAWAVTAAQTKDGKLFKFLTTVIRRSVRTHWWRAKHHGTMPEHSDALVPLWRGTDETPEQATLRLERTKVLMAAINGLPQRQRQVARLRYVECLPGAEIASRLGLSKSSIFTTLALIREKLRPALATLYVLPPTGRHGHVRMDRVERARTIKQTNRNAKRRRTNAKQRAQVA